MPQYWWDKLRSANKKRKVAADAGEDIGMLETLAPIDQMEAGRKIEPMMELTGTGDDKIVQPEKPVEMIQTIDGPKMIHEGEVKVTTPDGRVVVVPQRVLQKMERELNIPGYQAGGEVMTNLETYGNPEGVVGGGTMLDPAPMTNLETYGNPEGVVGGGTMLDPASPSKTISYDGKAVDVRDMPPEYQDLPSGTEISSGVEHETAPTIEELSPPVEAERPAIPMGAQQGYAQLLDMMDVDSKYWQNLRNEALAILGAQQNYEASQLEQEIARGGISGSQANAMRGRLRAKLEGQTSAMLGNMAKTQANQQQSLAQAAITQGLALEDARNRWAKWQQSHTQNQLTMAESLAGQGIPADRINEILGTNFSEEDAELLGKAGQLNLKTLEATLDREVLTSAKNWRMLGRSYEDLVQDPKFLDENGVPIITQGEYNLLLEPPKTLGDHYFRAVAADMTINEMLTDDAIRERVMFDNKITDPNDPEINDLIRNGWEEYVFENKGKFADNTKGYMLEIAQRYGRGDAGVSVAQEDPDVLKWASLTSGYDQIADEEKLDDWIEDKFRTWNMDEVDKAVTWFTGSPYYSEVMADTPGFKQDLYKVLSEAMTNETLVPDGESGYTFTTDFIYPWYQADSFFKYRDWYGNDLDYKVDKNGNVTSINGMSEQEYDDTAIDKNAAGVKNWGDYKGSGENGAVTNKDVETAWRSYINSGGVASVYWNGKDFDLKKFVANNFKADVSDPADRSKDPGIVELRNTGSNYYTQGEFSPNSENAEWKSVSDYLDGLNITDIALGAGSTQYGLDPETGVWGAQAGTSIANGTLPLMIFDATSPQNVRFDYDISMQSDIGKRIFAQFRKVYGEDLDIAQFAQMWGDGSNYLVSDNGVVLNFYRSDFDPYANNSYKKPFGETVTPDTERGAWGWLGTEPPKTGDQIDTSINVDLAPIAGNWVSAKTLLNEYATYKKGGYRYDKNVSGKAWINPNTGVYMNPESGGSWDYAQMDNTFKNTLQTWINTGTWIQGADGQSYLPLDRPVKTIDLAKGFDKKAFGGGDTHIFTADAFWVADRHGKEFLMVGGVSYTWDPAGSGKADTQRYSVPAWTVVKEGADVPIMTNTMGYTDA